MLWPDSPLHEILAVFLTDQFIQGLTVGFVISFLVVWGVFGFESWANSSLRELNAKDTTTDQQQVRDVIRRNGFTSETFPKFVISLMTYSDDAPFWEAWDEEPLVMCELCGYRRLEEECEDPEWFDCSVCGTRTKIERKEL